jgi:Domain of unknown function (DUF4395)
MNPTCPISDKRLNEISIRIGAGFVLFLAVLAIVFHNILIVILLGVDFFIRGFTRYPISPVSSASRFVTNVFSFKPNGVNAGPKIFAAKIGFLFCLTISILYFNRAHLFGDMVGVVLCGCAGLESFFGVCLGCHFYTRVLKGRKVSN